MNSFQAPFLAKRIETTLSASASPLLLDFQWILGSARIGDYLGAFLVPSAARLCPAVALLRSSVAPEGGPASPASASPACFPALFVLPRLANFAYFERRRLSWGFLSLNAIAVSLWTVGVFASLYAGALVPELGDVAQPFRYDQWGRDDHHVSAARSPAFIAN